MFGSSDPRFKTEAIGGAGAEVWWTQSSGISMRLRSDRLAVDMPFRDDVAGTTHSRAFEMPLPPANFGHSFIYCSASASLCWISKSDGLRLSAEPKPTAPTTKSTYKDIFISLLTALPRWC